MTDAVFSTQNANTPLAAVLIPGNPVSVAQPNVVPPYTGSNVNSQFNTATACPFIGSAAQLLPLASIGATKLSDSLNAGGQTGPASVLAGVSNGSISLQGVR